MPSSIIKTANVKNCDLIAGTQGSGKSSFFRGFFDCPHPKDFPYNYICLDYCKELYGKDNEKVLAEMNRRLDFHIERGLSFCYETASLGETKQYKRIKSEGFDVNIRFLFVYPIEKALRRIKKGFEDGERHDVARTEDQLEMQQHALLNKLAGHIINNDTVSIYDNSADVILSARQLMRKRVAYFEKGVLVWRADAIDISSPEIRNFLKNYKYGRETGKVIPFDIDTESD